MTSWATARANAFEFQRWLNKIVLPVDRGEWYTSPPTVNAYYNPQMNDINFPAGVLQPPLFDPRSDDAPNYGDTGGTIGHELTQGFDDEGRQFDAQGNLRDWWTPEDAKQFEQQVPHQRCCLQHARVPAGVLLQGGSSHGSGQPLQGVVGAESLDWTATPTT